MGMQTGNISALTNAGRAVSLQRPAPAEATLSSTPQPARLANNPEPDVQIRAGFGENTLSPSGAALQAIDDNLSRVRKIVPSMEQLQTESRARRAEQESAREEQMETPSQERAEAPREENSQGETRELRAYRQAPAAEAAQTTTAPQAPQTTGAQTRTPTPAQPQEPASGMTANRLNLLV